MKNFFKFVVIAGIGLLFTACEKNELDSQDEKTFDNFMELKEWAGDRLTNSSDKNFSIEIDDVSYNGNVYTLTSNNGLTQSLFEIVLNGEKKTLPHYEHTAHDEGGGSMSCYGAASNCSTHDFEDGTIIIVR